MKKAKVIALPLQFVSPNIRLPAGLTVTAKVATPEDIAKSRAKAIAARRKEFATQ